MSTTTDSRQEDALELERLRRRVRELEVQLAEQEPSEQLRESEESFRQLAENIRDVFFLLDLKTRRHVYCSPAFAEIWGVPLENLLRDPTCWLESVFPEDMERVEAAYQSSLRGERRVVEYRIRRPDGQVRWVRARAFPVVDQHGKMYRTAGIVEDITERKQSELSVQASEEINRLINEAVPGGVILFDHDGRILRANAMASTLMGIPAAELIGKGVDDFAGQLFREDGTMLEVEETPVSLCLSTGQAQAPGILRGLRPDGASFWLYGSVAPLKDHETGGVRLGVVSFFDITPRMEAEAKVRQKEEQQRAIAELTSDYAYTCEIDSDGDARLTTVTEGFTRITGYSFEEIVELGGWMVLIHPDDLHLIDEGTQSLLAGKQNEHELRILTKSGEVRWIRYSTRPIWDDRLQRVVRLIGAVQDITERREAKERLAESRRRLEALNHRMLDVQEQERRHLARELHDEIGQQLTGLQLILEMCRRRDGAEQQTRLQEAQRVIQELSGRVRDLSLDLRPSMLDDDLGLRPALNFLCRRYNSQTSIHVDLAWTGSESRFTTGVETAAYRIVQEALTNVARHAGVDSVSVKITPTPDYLEIVIVDRGKGFCPDEALARGATSGLSGMYERARLLGGEMVVESTRGVGTRIVARLPLGEAGSQ